MRNTHARAYLQGSVHANVIGAEMVGYQGGRLSTSMTIVKDSSATKIATAHITHSNRKEVQCLTY